MNRGVTNAVNDRAFTVSSFFSYYMFHPAEAPTERERHLSFWTSAALFILSLGIVHLVCRICLYDRKIVVVSNPNTLDKKTKQVFQSNHAVDNTRPLNKESNPSIVITKNKPTVETIIKEKKSTIIPSNETNVSSKETSSLSSRIKHFDGNNSSDKVEVSEKKRHKHPVLHKLKHWHPFRRKHKVDTKSKIVQI